MKKNKVKKHYTIAFPVVAELLVDVNADNESLALKNAKRKIKKISLDDCGIDIIYNMKLGYQYMQPGPHIKGKNGELILK